MEASPSNEEGRRGKRFHATQPSKLRKRRRLTRSSAGGVGAEQAVRDVRFTDVWAALVKQGWTSKWPRGRSLDSRYKYLPPGGHHDGEEGRDFFLREHVVLEHILGDVGGGASGCKGKDGSAFVEMTSGGAVTPTDTMEMWPKVLCLVAKAAATQTKVGKDDIVSLDLVAYDVVLMLLLKGWSLLGALKEMSWSLVSWALMKVASVVSYVETMQSLFVMSTKV
ncbi:hypothetical protein DVH05_028418 [Phytophthora capsici]|nr:hypothetical protein DVH05_023210 [Phytophthora capsici]KAG1690082.1 hypothetical protein DVH05_028418 [Phytophthora capsici]